MPIDFLFTSTANPRYLIKSQNKYLFIEVISDIVYIIEIGVTIAVILSSESHRL